jgi:hypothetical protein
MPLYIRLEIRYAIQLVLPVLHRWQFKMSNIGTSSSYIYCSRYKYLSLWDAHTFYITETMLYVKLFKRPLFSIVPNFDFKKSINEKLLTFKPQARE